MTHHQNNPKRNGKPWVIAMAVIVAAGAGYYLFAEGYINAWLNRPPNSVPLDLGEPPPLDEANQSPAA